jgi:hypothetical protein
VLWARGAFGWSPAFASWGGEVKILTMVGASTTWQDLLPTNASGAPKKAGPWIAGMVYYVAQKTNLMTMTPDTEVAMRVPHGLEPGQLMRVAGTGQVVAVPPGSLPGQTVIVKVGAKFRIDLRQGAHNDHLGRRENENLTQIAKLLRCILQQLGSSLKVENWNAVRRHLTPDFWRNKGRGGNDNADHSQTFIENVPGTFRLHAQALYRFRSAPKGGRLGAELLAEARRTWEAETNGHHVLTSSTSATKQNNAGTTPTSSPSVPPPSALNSRWTNMRRAPMMRTQQQQQQQQQYLAVQRAVIASTAAPASSTTAAATHQQQQGESLSALQLLAGAATFSSNNQPPPPPPPPPPSNQMGRVRSYEDMSFQASTVDSTKRQACWAAAGSLGGGWQFAAGSGGGGGGANHGRDAGGYHTPEESRMMATVRYSAPVRVHVP